MTLTLIVFSMAVCTVFCRVSVWRVSAKLDVRGRFLHGEALPLTFDHNCGMVFLELFDGDKLRRDLGQDMVTMLIGMCG